MRKLKQKRVAMSTTDAAEAECWRMTDVLALNLCDRWTHIVRHAYETTLPTIDETYLQFPRFYRDARRIQHPHRDSQPYHWTARDVIITGRRGQSARIRLQSQLDINYSESFGWFTNRRRHVTAGTDYCKSDAIVIRRAFRFIHRWRQDISDV